MCTENTAAPLEPPSVDQPVGDWAGETITLRPVDELRLLSVCDNTIDVLMPDQGVAKRLPPSGPAAAAHLLDAATLVGGKVVDAPLAEHGFSMLVTATCDGRSHRLLFDTGLTPTGCTDNLRRLDADPGEIEAIVCSHGRLLQRLDAVGG